jgi:multidrug resistance efflux pump
MIELMLGTYGVAWWLVFRKLKLLPINLWTVVGSILGAVSIIGFILLVINMYQPVTTKAQFYVLTTPILPQVRGVVTEVPVLGSTPLKSGDVLFRIDPTPFQARVNSVGAQLKLAMTRLEQESRLLSEGAGNQYDVDRYRTEVDRLTGDLVAAQFELDATTVRSPGEGYVTQVALRPGQLVGPLTMQGAAMVFVNSHEPIFIAGFRQNAAQHIDAGDLAEVAFDSIPGRVFTARVKGVLPALAEGQVQPSGKLIGINEADMRGRVPVQIELTQDMSDFKLPAGSAATVAVFTGRFHHFNIIRRILLRIKSWENWVFLP